MTFTNENNLLNYTQFTLKGINLLIKTLQLLAATISIKMYVLNH